MMHVPTGLPVACHRIAQDFVTEAVGEPIGRVLLIVLQMVRGISLKRKDLLRSPLMISSIGVCLVTAK